MLVDVDPSTPGAGAARRDGLRDAALGRDPRPGAEAVAETVGPERLRGTGRHRRHGRGPVRLPDGGRQARVVGRPRPAPTTRRSALVAGQVTAGHDLLRGRRRDVRAGRGRGRSPADPRRGCRGRGPAGRARQAGSTTTDGAGAPGDVAPSREPPGRGQRRSPASWLAARSSTSALAEREPERTRVRRRLLAAEGAQGHAHDASQLWQSRQRAPASG